MLEIKEPDSIKVGKLTKTIISIQKTKSELTTNDLIRLRNKILKEGKKKHKHCEIQITKVLSHQWFIYPNETKFNEYFNNLVLDTTKFNTFKQIQFYVYTHE